MADAVNDLAEQLNSIRSELRIAVTMNGGVSLAVYIGGVAHELDKLTRKHGGYAALIHALGYSTLPVIDVVTGTSAGGINGAALALAQANKKGGLDSLKSLWIQHGQIGDLLREPFSKGPPSLMKGDEHLLPRIEEALVGVKGQPFKRAKLTSGQPRPIDLTITTTLLEPVYEDSTDDLGTPMVQPQFAGLFTFQSAREDVEKDRNNDDFDTANIDETIAALAVAARASAGFPVAFEPTFIPVDSKHNAEGGRPDLGRFANWRKSASADGTGSVDRSRFAVDGGVLANTPTQPALQAIRRHQADNSLIRRVLILVHPHATEVDTVREEPSQPGKAPTLLGGLSGVARASSSVGSRTYVNEILQHNELAYRWRDGRQTTMAQFTSWPALEAFFRSPNPGAAAVPNGQGVVWGLIRSMRIKRSAFVVASQAREYGKVQLPFSRLVEVATTEIAAADRVECGGAPAGLAFLPMYPPVDEAFGSGQSQEWRWGLDIAVGITSLVSDLLRSLIENRNRIDRAMRPSVMHAANRAWTAAVNAGIEFDKIGRSGRLPQQQRLPDHTYDLTGMVQARLDGLWLRFCPGAMPEQVRTRLGAGDDPPGTDGVEVRKSLFRVAERLLDVLVLIDCEKGYSQTGSGDRPDGTLLGANPLEMLEEGGDNSHRALVNRLLVRLLTIEVLSCLFTEHRSTDSGVPTSPIEFVQLSAQVRQDFAAEFTSDDKLAGMSLNRFGAFLKRSWRANDWIWGRLDTIKLLMQVLITPDVIRDMADAHLVTRADDEGAPPPETLGPAAMAKVIMTEILQAVYASPDVVVGTSTDSRLEDLRKQASDEVTAVLSGRDTPLTNMASLAAYGLQIEVANEDVPWLVSTIETDQDDGATGAASAQFARQYKDLRPDPGRSEADKLSLLRAFATAGIGQEGITSQLPSDLVIRTGATAAASAATALSSDQAGLGFVGPAARVVRGMAAVPYWALIGLTHRGQLARTLAASVLALGVALIALSLVVHLPGILNSLIVTIGIASLITIFVYATLRTRSVSHGAALLGLMVPLAAIAVYRAGTPASEGAAQTAAAQASSASEGAAATLTVISVVVLMIWVVIVANVGPAILSPVDTVRRAWEHRRRWWRAAAALIVVAVAVVLLVAAFGDELLAAWRWFVDHSPFNDQVVSVGTLAFALCACAGVVASIWRSRSLRPHDGDRLTDPAGLAVAWSGIYGLLYIAAGIALITRLFDDNAPDWAIAASATAIVIGLVFALVVVHVIPAARQRKLIRRLASLWPVIEVAKTDRPGVDPDEVRMLQALERIGDRSRYLVRETPGASLHLSWRGRRVLVKVKELVAERGGAAAAASSNLTPASP